MSVRVLKPLDPHALAHIKETISLSKQTVKVGIPAGAKEVDGTSTALIAAANEFGVPSKGIPERPFIRTGIKNGMPNFKRLNRINVVKICQGEQSIDGAYEQLGVMAVGEIKKSIKTGNWVANDPATIKAKGSSKPLIDTGNMLQSVNYEVSSK